MQRPTPKPDNDDHLCHEDGGDDGVHGGDDLVKT